MAFISQSTTHSHNTGTQLIASLAAHAGRMLIEAAQRRKVRSSVRHLSERHLRDIGLTKHDVASIEQLPLPFSSARDLSETA
ncbi:MAG: hypothetical protein AAGA00_04425, partial [Pseudomonadota bacterium]